MSRKNKAGHVFMGLLWMALAAGLLHAQEPPGGAVVEPPPAADAIQSRMANVQSLDTIEQPRKDEIAAVYGEALKLLKTAEEWKSKAAPFGQILENGPGQLVRMQLDALGQPQTVRIDVPKESTLLELNHRLLLAEEDLGLAQARQAAIEQELAQRGERRKELPALILNARQRLRDVASVTFPPDASESDKLLLEARYTLAGAQRFAIACEIDALEKELQSFDIRGQLLKVQLDGAVMEVEQREKAVGLWREAVSARRQADARQAAAQARADVMDAAKASPVVRQYAEKLAAENAALVERRNGPKGLIARIDKVSEDLRRIESSLKMVKDEFTRARQKAESLGSSNAVGIMLRQSGTHLPDLREHRRNLRIRQSEIAAIQTERVGLGEQRASMANIESTLRELVPPIEDPALQQQQTRLSASLRGLLKAKRDALDALMDDYDALFEKLVDADAKERELIAETGRFEQFIDERVLWIRSNGLFGWGEARTLADLLRSIADPQTVKTIPGAIWTAVAERPAVDGAIAIALLLLIWFRHWLGSRLVAEGALACRSTCITFIPTLRAMGHTLAMVLPWPLLLWLIGDRLAAATGGSDLVRAVGAAAKNAAWVTLVLCAVREFLFPGGLATAHLGWAEKPVRTLRKHTGWMLALVPALVFILSLSSGLGDERIDESLGRLAYLAVLAVFALFAHVILRPANGAVPQWYALRTGAKYRFEGIAHAAGIAIPILLGLLTGLGYYYTAHRLGVRLFETAALAFGIGAARGCVSRWLLLARRRLAMDRARALRHGPKDNDTTDICRDEAPEIELGRIDLQMNRLIKTVAMIGLVVGMWGIWSRELPALRIFTQIEVWRAEGLAAAPAAQAPAKTDAQPAPAPSAPAGTALTVGDLLLACIFAGMTLAATRNIPGLLDLTVLSRTHYMRGERYAITTVARYLIAMVGITLTFNALGIGWSKVQWLVAALSVGLGFGLQEIFANFVSGIILLIERPIRVGDTVTVGGVNGIVSRIQIRATRITDFTRKELIVPNKEFITRQVMNWTLSDSIVLVTIPVGIARNADAEQAQAILYKLAAGTPHVMANPAPVVLLAGIEKNTLKFELRVYCEDVDFTVPVQHDLNMAIHKAFREAGIETA
ncbi:MAG TPA: mechanosensitive ion channel [Candidatus Hydrogenedentes bacterium]|nr:mechanosensitive ion channel [Candidatus Hydrogenedentota bacterium]